MKLLPCPFCGKTDAVEVMQEADSCSVYHGSYQVVCNTRSGGCGSTSGYYTTIEDAIKAWNKRNMETKMITQEEALSVLTALSWNPRRDEQDAIEFNQAISVFASFIHLHGVHHRIALDALQAAYRKHHYGDDTVGWDELGNKLNNAVCTLMGEEGAYSWRAALLERARD